MKLHERLAWIFATDLPATAKTVLVVLAWHADKQERCWPRQSIIARKSGLSLRAVVNTFKVLRKIKGSENELPILQENRRWRRSTVYTLNFQCAPDALLDVHQMHKGTVHRTSAKKKPKARAPSFNLQPCGRHHSPEWNCLPCQRALSKLDTTNADRLRNGQPMFDQID